MINTKERDKVQKNSNYNTKPSMSRYSSATFVIGICNILSIVNICDQMFLGMYILLGMHSMWQVWR